MSELQIGDQRIFYDREATIAVYEKLERSWADKCQCPSCKNFLAHRHEIYPASFVGLLDQLGVDPNKESEIVEYPIIDNYQRDQLHEYNGWLNFIGESISDCGRHLRLPDTEDFEYWFSPGLPGLGGFRDRRPYIAIEFNTRLRWTIRERPESHDTAGNIWVWTENGENVKVTPKP